jgi:hypothetical protein
MTGRWGQMRQTVEVRLDEGTIAGNPPADSAQPCGMNAVLGA